MARDSSPLRRLSDVWKQVDQDLVEESEALGCRAPVFLAPLDQAAVDLKGEFLLQNRNPQPRSLFEKRVGKPFNEPKTIHGEFERQVAGGNGLASQRSWI